MRLRITDYGLRITDYGLRITDYGLRITDYGLRITDYGLRITDYSTGLENRKIPIQFPLRYVEAVLIPLLAFGFHKALVDM
jgi:hypothetical protein